MKVHESPESASPSVTRAVAAALTGSDFHGFEIAGWQRGLLQLVDSVAPDVLPALVRWENKRRALPLRAANHVDIRQLAADRVADYEAWSDDTEALVLGSSLGGAAAYLSAALNAPFLPEPFILAFEGGSPDDRVEPHLERGIKLADVVGRNNPTAQLISHFDPIHDGWLTGFINHLRLKSTQLPPAYRSFINSRLKQGGTLIHLDCRARWLSFPLSGRHRYQIGGWGGISPQEFLSGSQRLDKFLAAKGSPHRGGWLVPGVEPVWQPESEWGSEPGFGDGLRQFADDNGYQYLPISLPAPHHYSWLAFRLYSRLWQKRGIQPNAAFIGMFNQYDPVAALERGLLPLWLVFNTQDSLAFLRQVKEDIKPHRVLFSALVTYSKTPDMVPWADWEAVLADLDWRSIGARSNRYPEDTIALWRWQERLHQSPEIVDVSQTYLTVADLADELAMSDDWRDRIPLDPLPKNV